MISTLLFFLEGRSEEVFLRGFLPRIVPPRIDLQYRRFEGKQDLQKRLRVQLRLWQRAETAFVVLRDQDADAERPDALVRIACHEVESWYLGDLLAVETALDMKGLARHQDKRKYREPDSLPNPARELAILTKDCYQKVSGSRAIGPHLRIDENRSSSLKAFVSGVRRLAGAEGEDAGA